MSPLQPQMSPSQATFAEPRAIPSHLFLRGGAAAWVVPPPHILPFLPAPWDGTCLPETCCCGSQPTGLLLSGVAGSPSPLFVSLPVCLT